MKININGKEKTYEQTGVPVVDLLTLENVEAPELVTVQINGKFLDKTLYENTLIKEGDRVEFLYFMGGGASWGRL